jgi:hypothetical protein
VTESGRSIALDPVQEVTLLGVRRFALASPGRSTASIPPPKGTAPGSFFVVRRG